MSSAQQPRYTYPYSFVFYNIALYLTAKSFAVKRRDVETNHTWYFVGLFWLVSVLSICISDSLNDLVISAGFFVTSLVATNTFQRTLAREAQKERQLVSLTRILEEKNQTLGETNAKLIAIDSQKTEFLSFATHQLKSPLTAILGYASMLREGSAGSLTLSQKKIAGLLCDATKHLTRTVDDFLTASVIERGALEYDMEFFDLHILVREIVSLAKIVERKKNLHIVFETKHASECLVFGDREKMRSVLVNVVDNAIKYTKAGSVRVRLLKKFSRSVFVHVSDTGIGISPLEQKSLFLKYRRGATGRLTASGSGLGLYLAREIVEAHDGRIWALSKGVGRGSDFYITLPLAKRKR